jgi:hypothetical protein
MLSCVLFWGISDWNTREKEDKFVMKQTINQFYSCVLAMECAELEEVEDSMHGIMFKMKYVYPKDEESDS